VSTDVATQFPLGVQDLPLDQITPNPANVRTVIDDLTELTASILELGVLEPILVHLVAGTTDEFMIIAGERRWTASGLAGLVTIPAIVRDEPDEITLAEIMLAENVHRAELSPIDEGHALLRIQESGRYRRLRDIAARVHRSEDWVAKRIRLVTKLDEESQDRVARGEVTIEDAVAVAGLKAPDEVKAQILGERDDDRRRAAIAEEERKARDAAARKEADRLWGSRLVTDGSHVAPGPWGKAEIGYGPGMLNLPEGMLDGDDIVPVWNPHFRDVRVWTTHPERYDLDLYVGGSIDTIPAKATPITELGFDTRDHRALSELRTCERDDVVLLKLPWANVVATTDPGLYTNKRRKGYVSEQDLVDAYMRRQDGRRPGEPLRGADRWGLSSRAEELLNERIAEQLDRLDTEARTALALGMASSLGSAWDVTSLVAELSEMLRQVVTSWANYPEDLEESDVVFAPGLLWALQACIDAGDPPPNLDALRTRIEVLTRGELVDDVEEPAS
jgi:ParB family chromosome partitioning protein